ncbi:MAG: dockerin type I repeat-containing protein, partial [Dehalococcoidia bacterium]|nr:dockerin type I repeat-containing protein [Dehalococcoidia bacterium]
TVSFNQIAASTGGQNIPEDSAKVLGFRRGDAKADGTVDIFDAMYIAQYIVGNRPLSQLSPLNAASVKHDGAYGDKIDIFDAMYIAQYIVGIRNSRFE